MKFATYQQKASDTAVFATSEDEPMIGPMYVALGLAGEAGEVADNVKKAWRNDQMITRERRAKIADELGDVLWYIAATCDQIGVSMEQVAEDNLRKLAERKGKGKLKEHT